MPGVLRVLATLGDPEKCHAAGEAKEKLPRGILGR